MVERSEIPRGGGVCEWRLGLNTRLKKCPMLNFFERNSKMWVEQIKKLKIDPRSVSGVPSPLTDYKGRLSLSPSLCSRPMRTSCTCGGEYRGGAGGRLRMAAWPLHDIVIVIQLHVALLVQQADANSVHLRNTGGGGRLRMAAWRRGAPARRNTGGGGGSV